MSMTRVQLVPCILLLLAAGCVDDRPPPSDVDRITPVQELPGWNELMRDLELTYGRDGALARWVEVFRHGLHASRLEPEAERRLASETDWWIETERSLEAIVGPEQVGRVIEWLEEAFGRRGGES